MKFLRAEFVFQLKITLSLKVFFFKLLYSVSFFPHEEQKESLLFLVSPVWDLLFSEFFCGGTVVLPEYLIDNAPTHSGFKKYKDRSEKCRVTFVDEGIGKKCDCCNKANDSPSCIEVFFQFHDLPDFVLIQCIPLSEWRSQSNRKKRLRICFRVYFKKI